MSNSDQSPCPYLNDDGHVAQRCPHCSLDDKPTREDEWLALKGHADGATFEFWTGGAIKIEVDGSVHIRTAREWHALAVQSFARYAAPTADKPGRGAASHVPAAFINAIAEEGTKADAVEYLQRQWNTSCQLRGELAEALAQNEDYARLCAGTQYNSGGQERLVTIPVPDGSPFAPLLTLYKVPDAPVHATAPVTPTPTAVMAKAMAANAKDHETLKKAAEK